jgi:hypothetical protein
LNFNYKILFLPALLADYVVVHELCHLIEFNHSKKFWQLVEKAVPAYPALRKAMRRLSPRMVGIKTAAGSEQELTNRP